MNTKQQQEKKNISLLKSLGFNTTNLKGYNQLYKTTPDTLGYKNSSMWAYTVNPITLVVGCNSTYFKLTLKAKKHNTRQRKKYTKTPIRLLDSVNYDLKEVSEMSIHDKVNSNLVSTVNFKYFKR